MFATVRRDYAFNGIAGKQPDWDALYAAIQPLVAQAEANHDPQAWFLALRAFTLAFKDGHVNLGGGDIQVSTFQTAIAGGYGLALRELDEGRVLVTYMTPGGPAEQAGIQLGAQVTTFNGQPISSAINTATIWGAPPSLDSVMRYQKTRYLTRAPLDTKARIEFTNPGGQPQTVTLTAVQEHDSFAASSYFFTYNAQVLPVEFKILPSGLGYIRVTSTSDNRDQIGNLFESALRDLQAAAVPGLILDLRVFVNLVPDSSGPPLGLAGFLTEHEIQLGQLQFFDAAANGFENNGAPLAVSPHSKTYHFSKIALLVAPGCSGACEVEAYALSQLPGVAVVGQSPTAGVLSSVTGGQFILPEKFSLQIPMGRYILPDGSLLIEGRGVPLTVRVPVDEMTILSTEDIILNVAEEILK
jgi:C-terminal processing protease CtpA/Prc